MNFDKYIDNPSGKSTVVTNRQMFKNMYKDKFDKLLVREQGSIKYTVYTSGAIYYIHMKIPSEVVPNFYYDVVVELYTKRNELKNKTTLREYDVRFYSNDPAFVYTFAHAFSKSDMYIKDLESKSNRLALTHKANVKNPKDEVWYVKSLFFAYLTMEKYNLFSRAILENQAKPYDKNTLLSNIMNADDKIRLRQSEFEKLSKSEKKNTEVKTSSNRRKEDTGGSDNIKITKTTPITPRKTRPTKVTKTSRYVPKK